MDYHALTERQVLTVFNYPHRRKKAAWGYSYGLEQNERTENDETICVVYRWNDTDKIWVIITCWRMSYKKRGIVHSIRWWFAHV